MFSYTYNNLKKLVFINVNKGSFLFFLLCLGNLTMALFNIYLIIIILNILRNFDKTRFLFIKLLHNNMNYM